MAQEIIWLRVSLVCVIVCKWLSAAADEGVDGNATKDLLLFQKLFEERRAEHKSAVQSLIAMQDYDKQYKMITLTLDRVFQVLESSQERLRRTGYVPGNDFPQQEDIRDALSQTLETTCLLGEVLMRLPDVTHRALASPQHQQHRTLLAWGVFFAAHSTFLPRTTQRLVHLMTQELGLAEKDPNYVNPYKAKPPSDARSKQGANKAKKKKSFKKGPSLSRHYGDL